MTKTENQRIREIRRENGLTMEAFGARLGVTKSAISRIESGGVTVTLSMRRFISREFHVSEMWLETGKGDKYVKLEAEEEVREAVEKFLEGEAPEMKLRLVKVLSGLSDEHLWLLEVKVWEVLTGEVLTTEAMKSRIMEMEDWKRARLPTAQDAVQDVLPSNVGQAVPEGSPEFPATDEEILAEFRRQEDEQRETAGEADRLVGGAVVVAPSRGRGLKAV